MSYANDVEVRKQRKAFADLAIKQLSLDKKEARQLLKANKEAYQNVFLSDNLLNQLKAIEKSEMNAEKVTSVVVDNILDSVVGNFDTKKLSTENLRKLRGEIRREATELFKDNAQVLVDFLKSEESTLENWKKVQDGFKDAPVAEGDQKKGPSILEKIANFFRTIFAYTIGLVIYGIAKLVGSKASNPYSFFFGGESRDVEEDWDMNADLFDKDFSQVLSLDETPEWDINADLFDKDFSTVETLKTEEPKKADEPKADEPKAEEPKKEGEEPTSPAPGK